MSWLPSMCGHTKYFGTHVYMCVQEQCDNEHHYYQNIGTISGAADAARMDAV